LNEAFEVWPLTGWTIVNNEGDYCVWNAGSADNGVVEPNYTGGTGNYADADSDNCGREIPMDTELWTPPMDLTQMSYPWLEFKSDMFYFDGGRTEYFAVDASPDGGTSWTNLL